MSILGNYWPLAWPCLAFRFTIALSGLAYKVGLVCISVHECIRLKNILVAQLCKYFRVNGYAYLLRIFAKEDTLEVSFTQRLTKSICMHCSFPNPFISTTLCCRQTHHEAIPCWSHDALLSLIEITPFLYVALILAWPCAQCYTHMCLGLNLGLMF